ncbi:hypothetical protein [Clostridium sp.]|uniref:hypothetical protein n=1 Tax=Clostridium sp. TaxID=1506 RepID=UPI0029054A3A|nr:hypothetical protein [Clostridium sp.]MDU2284832.1 hypothetical protein [Clostridium sp.]
MFIKIDLSVLNNISNFTDEELSCIENIALSMKERKHIVFSDYNILRKLVTTKNLSESSKRVFNSVLKRWSSISGLEKILNGKILVVYDEERIKRVVFENQIIYRVPLKYFNDTEKLLPLHIIGEDENDCNIYEDIAKRYIRDNNLGISINTRRVHGGGNRTGINYERELTQYNKICLVIADSDKEYESCNIGNTAKGIKDVYERNKETYITDIHILKVREKENLIPPNLYNMCSKSSNSKKDIKILEHIFNNDLLRKLYYYSDIKDGITYEGLLSNVDNRIILFKYLNEVIERHGYDSLIEMVKEYGLVEFYNYIMNTLENYGVNSFDEVSCTLLEFNHTSNSEYEEYKITNGIGYLVEKVRREIVCLELKEVITLKEQIYLANTNEGLKKEIENLKEILIKINRLFDILPNNIKLEWETI